MFLWLLAIPIVGKPCASTDDCNDVQNSNCDNATKTCTCMMGYENVGGSCKGKLIAVIQESWEIK